MHFPKYWIAAREKYISAWGWSDISPADAQQHAETRLAKIRTWIAQGGKSTWQQRYGYGNRPMCEPVLREFRALDGTLRAAVTLNSYGCVVLNTADFMFVDVDAPAPKPTRFMERMFGVRREARERQAEIFYQGVVARVNDWVGRWQGWGWRVYRTAAGIRLLATHDPFAPEDTMCRTAFDVFEADPLYRRLCATQKCFRARLTPKPWRCGMDKPGVRWPWGNEEWEGRFRKWETQYNKAAARYATCKLIGQFGDANLHPDFQEIIQFHDQSTRAETGLPLA
jgi:hypothetical protein